MKAIPIHNGCGCSACQSLERPDVQFSASGTSPTISWAAFNQTVSGNLNIDALLSGYKWGSAGGTVTFLSYSFPWANGVNAWFYGYNGEPYSDDAEWTAQYRSGLNLTQQNAVKKAFEAWANVANLSFTNVQDNQTTVGDIRLAFSSADSLSEWWGYANYPNRFWPSAGDIWINYKYASETDWAIGSANFESLLHEIGHSLGLKHPFEDAPQLPTQYDNTLYTVMSYTDAPNSVYASAGYSNGTYKWLKYAVVPETPMVLDIAAIQYLYGKNMSYRSGDDTYTFERAVPFFKTIWDSGGNDTISVENFSRDCVIRLIPGSYSSIKIDPASDNGGTTPTYDGTNNLGIAYECIIENATGGSGNDAIYGNAVGNILTGNSGKDTLFAGDGNDTLEGGDGSDALYGEAGNDTFDWGASSRSGSDSFYGGLGNDTYVLAIDDRVFELSNEGEDTVWVDFSYVVPNDCYVENIFGYGPSQLFLTGSSRDERFQGSSNSDTIDGGLGVDIAYFKGELASYNVTYNSSTKAFTVTDKISGRDGTDSIYSVEYLAFSDVTKPIESFIPAITDDYLASTATSGILSIGGSTSGSIEVAGDKDWFKVSLVGGRRYIFDAEKANGGLGDPYITLFSGTGTQLGQDDDSGEGLSAQLVHTAASSGTYYLEIKQSPSTAASSPSTGSYTVRASELAPTYQLTSSVTSVNEGASATFNLSTTNVASGTSVPYTISGVSSTDIVGGKLSGTATIGSDGRATFSVSIAADNLTEGMETLTVSAQGKNASVTILDTSISPVLTTQYRASFYSTYVGDTLSAAFDIYTTKVTDGTKLVYEVSGYQLGSIPADKVEGEVSIQNERARFFVPLTATTVADTPGAVTITLKTIQGEIITSSEFSINIRFTASNSEFRGSERSESIMGEDNLNQVFYMLGGDDGVSKSVWSRSNDVFIPGRGNDTIWAGGGTDSVLFEGSHSNYSVNRSLDPASQGKFDITSTIEGNDKLYNVERLVFADKTIAFDFAGAAGKAYRVYKAAFNRDPMNGDPKGLGYWISQIEKGMDSVEVASRFVDSPEFRTLYGTNPTNAQFLTKLYQNVLGRDPEATGYNWWLNELNTNPSKSKAKVLADFAEGTENQAGVASLVGNGIIYEPWVG